MQLEIRFGGPAIGYQQVSAQLYADKAITLGLVSTDEAIQNSAELATVAVAAPLETSPQMIMWDRAKHPDVRTIADLGNTGVPVLYYQTDTYMQYLLAAGLLRPEQVDGSYDGSPSRWVASGGDVAVAGFATSEPYIYKSELGEGRSYDTELQLIADTGYPMYGQALSVRAADKDALAPCLREARAGRAARRRWRTRPTRPGPTSVIVAAVQSDAGSVWSYSPGLAGFASTRDARPRDRRQRPRRHAGQLRHRPGRPHDRDPRAGVRGPEQADQGGADARAAGDQRVRRSVDRAAGVA